MLAGSDVHAEPGCQPSGLRLENLAKGVSVAGLGTGGLGQVVSTSSLEPTDATEREQTDVHYPRVGIPIDPEIDTHLVVGRVVVREAGPELFRSRLVQYGLGASARLAESRSTGTGVEHETCLPGDPPHGGTHGFNQNHQFLPVAGLTFRAPDRTVPRRPVPPELA